MIRKVRVVSGRVPKGDMHALNQQEPAFWPRDGAGLSKNPELRVT